MKYMRGACALGLVLASGCAVIAGIDHTYDLDQGASSTASGGGAGGDPCLPGTVRSCYEGPPETLSIGVCVEGTQACKLDGTGYGPCEGQVTPLEEDCSTPADESCDGLLDDGPPVCSGSILWASQLTGFGQQTPFASAVDFNGNALIAGSFEGTAEIGGKQLQSAGGHDAFVVKYTPDGGSAFSLSFGGPEVQVISDAAVDAENNAIVVGAFAGSIQFGDPGAPLTSEGAMDIFIAKLDPSGAVLWKQRFGDTGFQHAASVAVDSKGNIFVAGRFEGTLNWDGIATLTSAGAMNAFLVKLDPNGGHVWSKQFGDALDQGAEAVAVTGADEVLLAGWFEGGIDLGDGPKAASAEDTFVATFSPAGSLIWSGSIGGLGDARPTAITADKAGNVIVAGHFNSLISFDGSSSPGVGGEDMFLVKYSGDGTYTWHINLGSNLDDRLVSVATDSLNNIIVSGFLSGESNHLDFIAPWEGGTDAFLGKLDPSGLPIWLKTAGDGDDQRGGGVAIAPDDAVIWAGDFAGKIRLGNYAFTSSDAIDGFVARILE